MEQVLFHGGSHIIPNPEIREPKRSLGFGKGFYLTTSREQAERWVRNRLISAAAEGYVNTYLFDPGEVDGVLKTKIFDTADEEWVDFVLANRMQEGYTHDYDIVVGPVADDRVYTQFSLFEQKIISKETLIREFKTYRLVDQYLFHTDRALPYLKYQSHYTITK